MIRRLRQVAPLRICLAFAVVFLISEVPVFFLEWKLGQPVRDPDKTVGTALIYLFAAFYGIYRAVALHPFYREDYCRWLELTPWTVHKPLPLGPIALVWEDGIILGALILLTKTQPVHDSIRVLNLFLILHTAMLTATFWSTGAGMAGYLAAFGLGFAVRLWYLPRPCLAVATATYLVAYEGLWQSLARFPWRLAWSVSEIFDSNVLSEKLIGPFCGWPHDRFLRDIKSARRYRLATVDAILLSLLAGWWVSAFLALVPDPLNRSLVASLPLLLACFVVPVIRLSTYAMLYRAPISLWGRIRTGRWIIPGYDVCYVGPLLSLLAGIVICALAPREISLSLAVTTSLLLRFLTPPGLLKWRLTGRHRIVAGPYAGGQGGGFVQVP